MKKYLQQLLTRLETVRLYRCMVLLVSYNVFRQTFLSCFSGLLHICIKWMFSSHIYAYHKRLRDSSNTCDVWCSTSVWLWLVASTIWSVTIMCVNDSWTKCFEFQKRKRCGYVCFLYEFHSKWWLYFINIVVWDAVFSMKCRPRLLS